MQMMGLCGPSIIFAGDPGLVTHITNESASCATSPCSLESMPKYLRVNPLDEHYNEWIGLITQLTGMKAFLDKSLAESIWFQPSGIVHKRQRKMFRSFAKKFGTRDSQVAIYSKAMEVMEALIVKNEQVDLFNKLQQIVAILQLHFIMDYSLPAGWSVEKYLEVTNGVFGAMYAFESPSEWHCQQLDELLNDMMQNADVHGLLNHMEGEAVSPEEIKHNLTAGLLLGQQSLANALFWFVLYFAQNPEMLDKVREDEKKLPAIILELLRTHPPSSPFLMPYLALRDDVYNGQIIKKGNLIVVIPILMHLDEDVWKNALTFDEGRFEAYVDKRRRLYKRDKETDRETGAASPTEVFATMPLNPRDNCPVSHSKGPHDLCPFGVGEATCPMQGFSIALISNVARILIHKWTVEVHDLDSLNDPLIEHVLLDTGSRPWKRPYATFTPRTRHDVTSDWW